MQSIFSKRSASSYLDLSTKVWFITATFGQYAFGTYVILYYATSAATNHFEIWNKNLFSGITPGDPFGNTFLVFHILLASVILFGGPLQFMPFIRNRFRPFHRYLGRVYLLLAVLISLTGVIMTIQGKSFGSFTLHVFNSLSVIYILWFAVMTIKNAIGKNFQAHRQWALRLFMVANGVWFIRVWPDAWHTLKTWHVLNNFGTYPENVVAFFTYVLPLQLILLELYFLALRKKQSRLPWIVSIAIIACTLIMMVGIYGTINGWQLKVLKLYN
jgi:Predicted membrane protein (DUF2306)